MNQRPTVEILYFEGCPHYQAAFREVRAALLGRREATVHFTRVHSETQAHELRFLGSPTVRIDGADVDPGAQGRTEFGLQCRLYSFRGQLHGYPPRELIRRALNGGSD